MRAKQDPSFLAQFNGTKTSEFKVVTDEQHHQTALLMQSVVLQLHLRLVTKGVNAGISCICRPYKANVKTVGSVDFE